VTGFGSLIFIRGALPMLPGHIRVIPIAVTTWPDEATRTSNSACVWIAEATVEGRTYTARSRHSPANQLARQLVAAGFPDRPMVIRYRGLAGTMAYRSFYAGEVDLQRRRTTVAPRPVQRATEGGLSRQRDRAKMRFIAGGR
jgi:hypothetical protein